PGRGGRQAPRHPRPVRAARPGRHVDGPAGGGRPGPLRLRRRRRRPGCRTGVLHTSRGGVRIGSTIGAMADRLERLTNLVAVLLETGRPLTLGGIEGAAAPTLAALPDVPALPALFDAYRRRARVTFRYRGGPRRLDPYGILFRNGHWYVVGCDADREAIRAFRADRIESAVESGPPAAFERPEGFDPASALRDEPWRFGDEEPVEAMVLVSPTQAGWVEADLGAPAV